jgi:lipoprotein-anchoring transpeptidase ErfK/SrfK
VQKIVLSALVGALAISGPAPAATQPKLDVFFTRGEQLHAAKRDRTGAPLVTALRGLLAGPTPAETRNEVRTNIPAGTQLRGVTVRDKIAYVDLNGRFEQGGGTASMTARLAQLVYTATQFPVAQAVRLKLDGKLVVAIGGDGIMVDHPLRRSDFAAPRYKPQPPAPAPRIGPTPLVRSIQTRLRDLGYLTGTVDGVNGPKTRSAILAFQKWSGLARTGQTSKSLAKALATAQRPTVSAGPAHRIDLDLRRQIAFLVEGGRVAQTVHISSGATATATPRGTFKVFRKELHSWSVPFRQWLPYASYFTGGIAFHEYPDVPVYPASHGCVRVPSSEARTVYSFASLGTTVRVV